MTAIRTWQDMAAKIGIDLFAIGVCLLFLKYLSFRMLYGKHDNILVGFSEAGLIASAVSFGLVLFDRRIIRRVILAIGSLVLAYLFASSITWWVMIK